MKAISLWQPWASLWLSQRKIHETRHWPIQVPVDGFWLAVHAAKHAMSHDGLHLDDICDEEFGPQWFRSLPRGALIGRVFITACLPAHGHHSSADDLACGDFSGGRYAWRRSEYRRLLDPIPYRGMQGIFTVPDWPEEMEIANR